MTRRRYQRIEGRRKNSRLRDLICDLARLVRWIAAH